MKNVYYMWMVGGGDSLGTAFFAGVPHDLTFSSVENAVEFLANDEALLSHARSEGWVLASVDIHPTLVTADDVELQEEIDHD